MEVVVIGDGGDAEAGGVVLGCGVGPIAVAGILRDAGVTVLRQFGCFFILALHTAHYLNSVGEKTKRYNSLITICKTLFVLLMYPYFISCFHVFML